MASLAENKPYFPLVYKDGNGDLQYTKGVTLLEELSGKFLAALISKYNLKTPEDQLTVAKLSIELAQTLIAQLDKVKQ